MTTNIHLVLTDAAKRYNASRKEKYHNREKAKNTRLTAMLSAKAKLIAKNGNAFVSLEELKKVFGWHRYAKPFADLDGKPEIPEALTYSIDHDVSCLIDVLKSSGLEAVPVYKPQKNKWVCTGIRIRVPYEF